MIKRVQLVNSTQQWRANGRYKVNTVVTYLGVDYQNTTGANSLPSLLTDWEKISYAEIVPSYKVYTAILTQTGTSAPTATVLENTTGLTITWNRSGAFGYNTNQGLSPDQNKIAVFFNYGGNSADFRKTKYYLYSTGGDYKVGLQLETGGTEGMTSTIEIRVYN